MTAPPIASALLAAARRPLFALALLLGTWAAPAWAQDSNLLRAIPPDAVAAYVGTAAPSTGPESAASPGLAAMLIDGAQWLGLLSEVDPVVRLWLDGFAFGAVASGYPHAVVLLDLSVEGRQGGGHVMSSLSAGLVIRVGDKRPAVEQRIQSALNIHTNRAASTLSSEMLDGGMVHSLKDSRLAKWAEISWGAVGDDYVITLGPGAFERLAQNLRRGETAAHHDDWLGKSWTNLRGSSAAAAWYLRFDRLKRAGDEGFSAKVEGVLEGLGLAESNRGLWVARRDGRAVDMRGLLEQNGRTVPTVLADASAVHRLPKGVVPEAARRCSVFTVEPRDFFRSIGRAWLAACSPESRRESLSFWRGIEAESGVSFHKDIAGRVGGPIVIHDHPPHALRLPLARTILMPLTAPAVDVQRALDGWFAPLRGYLAEESIVRLRRADDGVWHLFFGLNGPAVMVAQRWLVISFSPEAARQIAATLPKGEVVVEPPRSAETTE